ncbi:MAG: riboflavin synthase [Phycisphaerales bacterium]|nr:riboflavin synthase [Phycisphaerales bacterium]
MFTGIIQHIGAIESVTPTPSGVRVVVDPCGWSFVPSPGDSVAVNGCCLTLVDPIERHNGLFTFDAIPETIEKTTIGMLAVGDRVNLEPPLRMGDRLDGHTVQGHVDGRGIIESVDSGDGYRVRVKVPGDLMKFMIPKGSITIDGISLTLAEVDPKGQTITIALIPETLERTTLGMKAKGAALNIEADMMVKTIVHTMEHMQQA